MKKKIFLQGQARELDFANPAVFEREMIKDVTELFEQENAVPFSVVVDNDAKTATFSWPCNLNGKHRLENDGDPDMIRDEYLDLIIGPHGFIPKFPGCYYTWSLQEFYDLYRDLSNEAKASRFTAIEFRLYPDAGFELQLTF